MYRTAAIRASRAARAAAASDHAFSRCFPAAIDMPPLLITYRKRGAAPPQHTHPAGSACVHPAPARTALPASPGRAEATALAWPGVNSAEEPVLYPAVASCSSVRPGPGLGVQPLRQALRITFITDRGPSVRTRQEAGTATCGP